MRGRGRARSAPLRAQGRAARRAPWPEALSGFLGKRVFAVAARGGRSVGTKGARLAQQRWLRERLRGRGLEGVARAAREAQTTEACTAQLLAPHSVAAGRHLDPRCALRAASRASRRPAARRWVRGWTECVTEA